MSDYFSSFVSQVSNITTFISSAKEQVLETLRETLKEQIVAGTKTSIKAILEATSELKELIDGMDIDKEALKGIFQNFIESSSAQIEELKTAFASIVEGLNDWTDVESWSSVIDKIANLEPLQDFVKSFGNSLQEFSDTNEENEDEEVQEKMSSDEVIDNISEQFGDLLADLIIGSIARFV